MASKHWNIIANVLFLGLSFTFGFMTWNYMWLLGYSFGAGFLGIVAAQIWVIALTLAIQTAGHKERLELIERIYSRDPRRH